MKSMVIWIVMYTSQIISTRMGGKGLKVAKIYMINT